MFRTLARRGASVLVATALIGGGLALGGGTASAANDTGPIRVPLSGYAGGSVNIAAYSVLVAGMVGGSVDPDYASYHCLNFCPQTRIPNYVELLIAALQGRDRSELEPLFYATPNDDLPFGSSKTYAEGS